MKAVGVPAPWHETAKPDAEGWQVMWRTRGTVVVGRPALIVHARAVSTARDARHQGLQAVSTAFQGEVRVAHLCAGAADSVVASTRELSIWRVEHSALPAETNSLWRAEEKRKAIALNCSMRIAAALSDAVAAGLLTRTIGRELRRRIKESLAIE